VDVRRRAVDAAEGLAKALDVATGAASAGALGRWWGALPPGVGDVDLDEALVEVAGPIGVESGVGGF